LLENSTVRGRKKEEKRKPETFRGELPRPWPNSSKIKHRWKMAYGGAAQAHGPRMEASAVSGMAGSMPPWWMQIKGSIKNGKTWEW